MKTCFQPGQPLLRHLLTLLLTLLGASAAGATEPGPLDLKVVYLERPPYYWTENGQPRGFLLELTQKIFERAGITASYMPVPPNRILAELRENKFPACSIGWFKNPERESYAQFSLPIYRDRPLVLLTTKDRAGNFRRHDRLEDVFRDPTLVLAQVDSFSLGETVDRLQKQILVRNLTVSSSQSVLPRLILEGRASYMLVAPEEVPTLLRSANVDPEHFTTLTMADIPTGNLRHLIFSAAVPMEALDRINAAIRVLTDQDALLAQDPSRS